MKKPKYNFFSENFNSLLKSRGITQYRLAEDTELRAPNIHKVASGERRPSDDFLSKVAAYEALRISYEELLAWRMIDEYGPHIVRQAGQALAEEEKGC